MVSNSNLTIPSIACQTDQPGSTFEQLTLVSSREDGLLCLNSTSANGLANFPPGDEISSSDYVQ